MGLSDDQKLRLKVRYEAWGIDDVRKELERVDRKQFVHPDITEFAQNWVIEKEARLRRRQYVIDILAVFITVQIGIALALLFLL